MIRPITHPPEIVYVVTLVYPSYDSHNSISSELWSQLDAWTVSNIYRGSIFIQDACIRVEQFSSTDILWEDPILLADWHCDGELWSLK